MAGSIEPLAYHWEKVRPDGTWERVAAGPGRDVRGKAREAWRKAPERGTKWRAFYRDPQGQARSMTLDTKTQAQNFLSDTSTDTRRGKWADPALARIPFEQWGEDWLDTKATWAESTRNNNVKVYRKHVQPFFTGRRVGDVDRIVVKKFIAKMVNAGYAPKYVKAAVSTLHGVLELARESGAIHVNPASRQGLPKTVKKPPMFLTPKQVQQLVAVIRELVGRQYALAALLLAYTGLRPSEMCGLRVGAIDLLHGRVMVVETLSIVQGRLVEGPTKTKKHRSVPLPKFLADELSAYLAERRENLGRPLAADDRLFVGKKSGSLRETWFQQQVIRRASVKVGLKGLRAYDLRHTFASMLIANGAHPKAVQERMGHENISETMDTYGHLFKALEKDATDALDEGYRAVRDAPAEVEAEVVTLAERRPVEAPPEETPTSVDAPADTGSGAL